MILGSMGMTQIPKHQSSQWESPTSPWLKMMKQVCSMTKSMLIVFFNIGGAVHHEFIPGRHTINGKFYCNVLNHLREYIGWKWLELCCEYNWLLQDDNTPCHRAPILHARFGPLQRLPFPEDELAAERLPFRHCGGDPIQTAESAWHSCRTWLPELVPAVATALGALYRCISWLFWRGWCPNLNQTGTFLYVDLVSEPFDTTSYFVGYPAILALSVTKREILLQVCSGFALCHTVGVPYNNFSRYQPKFKKSSWEDD